MEQEDKGEMTNQMKNKNSNKIACDKISLTEELVLLVWAYVLLVT
jgi:hypothetical protein